MTANNSVETRGKIRYHTIYQTDDGTVLFEWETNSTPAAEGEIIDLFNPERQSYLVTDIQTKPYMEQQEHQSTRLKITVTVQHHPTKA